MTVASAEAKERPTVGVQRKVLWYLWEGKYAVSAAGSFLAIMREASMRSSDIAWGSSDMAWGCRLRI